MNSPSCPRLGPPWEPDDAPEPILGQCYPCVVSYWKRYPDSKGETVPDAEFSCLACDKEGFHQHLCVNHAHVCVSCEDVAYCTEHKGVMEKGICPACVKLVDDALSAVKAHQVQYEGFFGALGRQLSGMIGLLLIVIVLHTPGLFGRAG